MSWAGSAATVIAASVRSLKAKQIEEYEGLKYELQLGVISGKNMRLWSIHPCYLDSRGLVALWREGLLAQKVLQGNTRGYRNHPQLIRFKAAINPVGAIAAYLKNIADEADKRGYHFDRSKITNSAFDNRITVTSGQLEYEFKHLLGKLKQRNPELYLKLNKTKNTQPHPIFDEISGDIEGWEFV